MWVTSHRLTYLQKVLDASRSKISCNKPRMDSRGSLSKVIRKVPRNKSPYEIEIPYGIHGSDYLEIDPETLEIRCGACAGTIDSTVISLE